MAKILLVHGAWQGAWCWERVQPILEAHGHQVLTPTLTGGGARSDEMTATVLTDWSLNCFASPLHLPEMRRSSVPRVYVSAKAEGYQGRSTFGPLAERARSDGCRVVSVDSGHDIMIEAPGQLAEAIVSATRH